MIESLIIGILEQGLIYGIMALGVYISYKILDFPDLSVDGTFTLGISICFVCINRSINPWLAILFAFFAGCIAGAFTGFLNVRLRIKSLLCGILTMTALYSVNYEIMGKASDFLPMDSITIFSQTSNMFSGHLQLYQKIVILLIIALASKFLLDWYLRTKSGFLLRSVGDNELLVVTLAKNPGIVKIIGLAISNGLAAVAGAVYCQYGRAFNVGAGTGTVVMGLAAVIIGTTVFSKMKYLRITTGVLLGMIVYKACISIALQCGLLSRDTNLVITILFILTLVTNNFILDHNKRKKCEVRKDA